MRRTFGGTEGRSPDSHFRRLAHVGSTFRRLYTRIRRTASPERSHLRAHGPQDGRTGAGRSRGGLRGHRHQPALRGARVLQRPARRRHDPRQPLRGGLPDLLVAHDRGQHQVRRVHPEGRQPRRGRHLRAARPDSGRPHPAVAAAAVGRHHRGHLRRGAAVRGRDHHPVDLGALGRRGSGGRHRGGQALRRTADLPGAGGPLPGAETRARAASARCSVPSWSSGS